MALKNGRDVLMLRLKYRESPCVLGLQRCSDSIIYPSSGGHVAISKYSFGLVRGNILPSRDACSTDMATSSIAHHIQFNLVCSGGNN
ncbi:hypothetical protein VUR80DRAFT_8940 [Thermomyces stellatus]